MIEAIITVAQEELKKEGYQWTEHIMNDGPNDCIICVTESTDPEIFDKQDGLCCVVSWGRHPRHMAWAFVLAWLYQRQLEIP